MTHSMTVDLQCSRCDDGVLTATVGPDEIQDLVDAGCGHAEALWREYPASLTRSIWQAVLDKEERLCDDAMESRMERERDRA